MKLILATSSLLLVVASTVVPLPEVCQAADGHSCTMGEDEDDGKMALQIHEHVTRESDRVKSVNDDTCATCAGGCIADGECHYVLPDECEQHGGTLCEAGEAGLPWSRSAIKGSIEWTVKSTSHLAGILTYEGKKLSFVIMEGETLTLLEEDGTVMYENDFSNLVTIENETFMGNDDGAFLHLGKHTPDHRRQRNSTLVSLMEAATEEQFRSSQPIMEQQLGILMNDTYDNLVLELLVAMLTDGVNGVEYPVLMYFYSVFQTIQRASNVIDEETIAQIEAISTDQSGGGGASFEQIEAISTDQSGGGEASLSQSEKAGFWGRRRRRRRRYPGEKRCTYPGCYASDNRRRGFHNDCFGLCGMGCSEIPVCIAWWDAFNSDKHMQCHRGCEWHDGQCCPGSSRAACIGLLIALDAAGGCGACWSHQSTCR